jgi:membrane protein implicated in regulation of membrane protease activity
VLVGIHRLTAGLFGLAGLLALFGAIGFAANVPLLEHGIILSGIVFVPALAAAMVLLHRVARGENIHTSSDVPQASAEPVLQ